MSLVTIKFRPYFKEPMLSGMKTLTSRKKRMGNIGDHFEAFGARFELVSVEDADLYSVSCLWEQEGCLSREHFIRVWNEIHPRTGYNDYQRVYLHEFKQVQP